MAPRKPAKKATRKKTPAKKAEPKEISPEELANGEDSVDTPEAEEAPASVNFDALQAFANQVVSPGSKTPRASAHLGDGDPYVRMLNTRGDATAVSYRLVPDRIMDGYHFIKGEPTVPILRTPDGRHQDIPECMYDNPNAEPNPRHQPNDIRHSKLALQVWFGHMRDDMETMRERDDLDWNYMRSVGEMIVGLPEPE